LAAIAQNGDFFVLDQVNVAITIVINAHGAFLRLVDGRILGFFQRNRLQSLTKLCNMRNIYSYMCKTMKSSCS